MVGMRLELVVVVVAVVHRMACMMVVDKMGMMALVDMDCRPLVPMSTMMGRMGRMIVDTMGMAVDRMMVVDRMVVDRMVVGKMELLDMNLFEFIDRLYFKFFFLLLLSILCI